MSDCRGRIHRPVVTICPYRHPYWDPDNELKMRENRGIDQKMYSFPFNREVDS